MNNPQSVLRGSVLAAALLIGLLTDVATAADAVAPDAPACARPQGGKSELRIAPFLRGIALSDAQQNQIKALNRDMPRPDKKLIDAQRQAMWQLISAPIFDAAKAQLLINAQQQDMQRAMLARLEAEQKMFAILTSEQQAQVKKNMAAMPPEHPHQPPADE